METAEKDFVKGISETHDDKGEIKAADTLEIHQQ